MDIQISVALNEPYFRCKVPLNQNPETLARIFSNVATQLLKMVHSDERLTESYRMEVKFDNHEKVVEFCISLKTTAWYDVFLKGKPGAIKKAQDYITKTEQQFPPEPSKAKKTIDVKGLEDYYTLIICPFYKKNGYCDCYRNPHPEFLCREDVQTKDDYKKKCGFYLPNEHIIKTLSKKPKKPEKLEEDNIFNDYVFALRWELVRMVLMIPLKHKENTELVTLEDFWKDLLDKRQRMGFHLVAFNFGMWESEQRNDPNAFACHGHANLYFDENAWDGVKRISERETHLRMNKCNNPGPNYLRKNCEDLKVWRLNEAKCDCLNTQNARMRDDISGLQDNINQLVGNNNQMRANIDELFNPLKVWRENALNKFWEF